MKEHTKVNLIVVAGLLAVGWWYFFTEDCGVGVNSVWWLPREAHNVTYRRDYLGTKAEFDIEREALEKWCARRKRPLRELDGEGYYSIIRPLGFLERRGVIAPIAEPNKEEADLRRMQRAVKVFHAGDLYYEECWDNGGGYWIGYNVKEKRGYYRYCSH